MHASASEGLRLPATVSVQYRFIDNYHVFTSDDVFGLYVASRSPEQAYASLKPALEMLVRENVGLECEVEPTMSLREFLEDRAAQERTRSAPQVPHPATLSNRLFVLRCNS